MDDVAQGRWQERTDERLRIISDLSLKNSGHIETINSEMGVVQVAVLGIREDVTTLKADMAWLKKFFWATFGAAITAVVLQVLQLVRVFPIP